MSISILPPLLGRADWLDIDYELFHKDFGFGWTLFWLIFAVGNYTVNMLFLQLLTHVRKIAEK